MSQKLNSFSGRQFLDANGDPYSGAQLFVYTAGSSTKATTTKDSDGLSAHANPIILNSRGEPGDGSGASQAIWQTEGTAVKLVLAPSTDTDPPLAAISTWDNLFGVNDTTVSISQWVGGPTPTYISATTFSLVGDQTTAFHVGRRLKTINTAGTVYSTITDVAYTTLTTVTIVNDSGSLDSGLSNVSYGIITADNTAAPYIRKIDDSAVALQLDGADAVIFNSGGATSKVQSITSTVDSNALTAGLNPCILDFRSSSLTSGEPNTRRIDSAISLVVPSGATLGTVDAVQSRLYLLAIDNAGTVELAIVKSSGGNDLSETGVISTTALSTGSDSANVIYSTTARTNVAYRVVGFIESTQATAGTWATAPSLIQGAGGLALTDVAEKGFICLDSGTVSSAATLDIDMTGFTAYRNKMLVIDSFIPATDLSALRGYVSTDGGSTFDSGAANYRYAKEQRSSSASSSGGGGTDSAIQISTSTGSVAGEPGVSAKIMMYHTTNSTILPQFFIESVVSDGAPNTVMMTIAVERSNAQDTDAFRLAFSAGNITSGNWALFGSKY